MASNKSVIVLTPHGRRQTVKVSPNTTILQIIEEVCTKHGFNPEEYDVRHHKQILDTNTTLAFSGLPNNAQLDLIACSTTRTESDVIIGIHLENGNRLLGTFKPSNTIFDILSKLTPDELDPSMNSVIIYMRREIFGLDSFKSVNLKSLGLTSGRAMLRLIHKLPEELKTQANISAPLPAKPVEEKPYVRKLQRIESPVRSPVQPTPDVSMEETKPNPPSSSENNNPSNSTKAENIKKSTLQKPTQPNLLDTIKSEKKKKSQKRSEPMQVEEICSKEEDVEQEFLFVGDRNAMLFSLESAQSVPSEDLPDDFFELTIDDAKKLLRDIKRRRLEYEGRPLLTTNLRKLEESKRQLRQLNTYTKTIIRVQFPDRTVLQGTFSTVDEVRTVIGFVREYLENKSLNFYLYTTPPKLILDEGSKLVEIGCVPGALLYFGTHTLEDSKTFLRKDLMDKFTTTSTASMAAAKLREKATRKGAMEDEDIDDELLNDDSDVNVGASTSAQADYDKPSTSKEANVPKWFKAGK